MGATAVLSLSQGNGNRLLGGSVVKCQCFRSALELIFLGPTWDKVVWAKRWAHSVQKWPREGTGCDGGPVIISGKSQSWLLVVRGVGGQLATFPNCFETKFREAQHEQRVLSQKMGSYNPKMGESFHRCFSGPIIISGKGKSWVLALGGSVVKGKLFQINQSQPLALPNNQQKH